MLAAYRLLYTILRNVLIIRYYKIYILKREKKRLSTFIMIKKKVNVMKY